jgi:hypothetical protein
VVSAGGHLGGEQSLPRNTNIKHNSTMYATNYVSPTSAPVTTATALPGLSGRYIHIPTSTIVSTIREAGWEFASGTARKGRTPERQAHAAHVLRFSNASLPEVNGNRIEAVLLNSHDGSTAFELSFGVFRLACANGLVVQTASAGSVRLIHSGLALDNVFLAARSLVDRAPEVAAQIEAWSRLHLPAEVTENMAHRMGRARWGERFVAAPDLLQARRSEDTSTDLWTLFNRAQESILRGGVEVTLRKPTEDGQPEATSVRRATAIRGAVKQMRLNQELFSIASEFAA